jgi:hypothetical protein
VLTRESWEGASLQEIVAEAIEPYRSCGETCFRIRGDEVRLSPRIALASGYVRARERWLNPAPIPEGTLKTARWRAVRLGCRMPEPGT